MDITAIFEPTVELAELAIHDTEYGTDPDYKPDGNEFKHSKFVGDYSPYFEINGMKFHADSIQSFELDLSGFVPKITVAIHERGGLFAAKSYPTDGDQISLYIKSNNTDFKPIRQDYRVLDSWSDVSADETGEINVYVITGTLDIPMIYSDNGKSFAQLKSTDVLQKIAKELKLGYATNETEFNDLMTRICPYINYEDFILNDVLPSAYKNDDSFFNCYIDQHYYLTLVEVNQLITHDRELDKATVHFLSQADYRSDDPDTQKELTDVFLSNSKFSYNTPYHITGYTPLNNSGYISMRNGYRTYHQYYDKTNTTKQQYFMETLNTKGSEGKIILKGRENEDHTKQVKTLNTGFQFNANVHENYQHARVQNKYNNDEFNKMQLQVDLAAVNPGLRRYQTIPIYIMTKGGNDIRSRATEDKNDGGHTVDIFLSGFYVITGMKFIWDSSTKRFYQQLITAKREYDIPS